MDGNIWPEQEAVEKWLKDMNMVLPHKDTYPLKKAVTAYRLKIQEEKDKRIEELESKLFITIVLGSAFCIGWFAWLVVCLG